MRKIWTILVVAALLPILSGGSALSAADFTAFDEEKRTAIDRRVLAQPDLRTKTPKDAFYGTLAGWGIGRMPMDAEEELELARAEHRKILKAFKTSPAPPITADVLKRLIRHLPGVAAQEEFEYSLTIIETPGFRSWTVGGGFLYLSRPLLTAVTGNDNHAKDRLAFVLAHEIGHIVRQHCRVGYQLLKLEDFAVREELDDEEISKLKKAVRKAVDRTGDRLRFLYEPVQELKADLFAAHLCRNADFDEEAGWDILRQGVLTEETDGDLDKDPAHAMISYAHSDIKKTRPTAGDRLRRLCYERDGVFHEGKYGFWEYDADADRWIRRRVLRIPPDGRVLILVHGMDSSLRKCYIDLAREIARDSDFRDHRILGFLYPNDASLARVGEFLYRELSRELDPRVNPAFICHSAGGLVVRYYAEVKDGPFSRIILQGTPNHGSDWAKLRPVVETGQFVKDLREGYSAAIKTAILDGQGQIAHDLQPGSLFLNHLNNREIDRSRYVIMRGRRFGGAGLWVLGRAIDWGRGRLKRKINASDAPGFLRKRALRTLAFRFPEEVRRGDLFVSLQSAELDGVSDVRTFKRHHGKLSKDEEIIEATLKILKADQGD